MLRKHCGSSSAKVLAVLSRQQPSIVQDATAPHRLAAPSLATLGASYARDVVVPSAEVTCAPPRGPLAMAPLAIPLGTAR